MGYYNSLEDCYIKNYKLVFAYISDYTTDYQNAQDIAAIVWAKVAENSNRYLKLEQNHLNNYLRRMVKTAAADFFAVEKRQFDNAEQAREALALMKTSNEEFLHNEQLAYLEQAKEILSEEEGILIYLRFYKGQSAKEVSDTLEISEGAVRARQYRILKKLKHEILRIQQLDKNEDG